MVVIIVLLTINGFIFNDYIKYLETSKCNCANDKQKKLHTFINYYSYVTKIISISIVSIIVFLFILSKF